MSTQQLRPPPLQNPFLCRKQRVPLYATGSPSSLKQYSTPNGIKAITLDEFPPNALRRKRDPHWRGGFNLGLDLGMARTGVALSQGFSIRPLTVLEQRGQKLEVQRLKIAEQEGFECVSTGWGVHSEHGTTTEAIDRMINMGVGKSSQQRKLDAYAAMMVLERYFCMAGQDVELVLPKKFDLHEKLQRGPPRDIDFFLRAEFEG